PAIPDQDLLAVGINGSSRVVGILPALRDLCHQPFAGDALRIRHLDFWRRWNDLAVARLASLESDGRARLGIEPGFLGAIPIKTLSRIRIISPFRVHELLLGL